MPFEFAEELTGSWLAGPVLCKIVEFLQTTVFGVNVTSVAFIALDRLLLLARPITWKRRMQVAKYMVGISWLLPLVLSSPDFYLYNIVKVSVENASGSFAVCSPVSLPYLWLDKLYWSLELYYVNLLPFGIIIFCYVGILRHVVKMKRVGVISGFDNSADSNWHKIKINTTRLALTVITTFIICWIPSIVLLSLRIAYGSESVHRSTVAYEVALFMAYTNEALNPVLYGYFDSFFKRMLTIMIKRRVCCWEPDIEGQGSSSIEDGQHSVSLHAH